MNPEPTATMPPNITPIPVRAVRRPTILTVQGCAGCQRSSKQKVATPFGTRIIHNRLKMTQLPRSIATYVDTTHPRSQPKPHVYSAWAKLCKECRKQAIAAGEPKASTRLPDRRQRRVTRRVA